MAGFGFHQPQAGVVRLATEDRTTEDGSVLISTPEQSARIRVPKFYARKGGGMKRQELEHFLETMRTLTVEVENLSIEKDAYLELLLSLPFFTLAQMKQEVDRRLDDSDIRKTVRQQYSGMWKAIDDAAMNAWTEEQLHQLPPTDKPN
jgi:hypothetical protein